MKTKMSILVCLMLVISLSVCTATVEVGVKGGNTQKLLFDYMERFFSDMTATDLEEAFKYQEMVSPFYQDVKYSEFYDKYVFVEAFRSAWTDLEMGDYPSAYAGFGTLRNRVWTGDNAEAVKTQVDALRKYAKALDQMKESKTEALKTLESIDLLKVAFPKIRESILTNIEICVDAVYNLAMEHLQSGNYKKALDLFKSLVAGEYRTDTESKIEKLEGLLSEIPLEAPEIILSGLVCTEVTPVSLTLTWKDTVDSNTYVISFAPKGMTSFSSLVVENTTSTVLDSLIPATDYDVTVSVKDFPTEALAASFSTLRPERFKEYSAKYPIISLFNFNMDKMRTFGLQTVVNTDQITKMNTSTIPLPRFDMGSSDTGYVILASFMCDPTDNDKVLNCRGVLRVSGGGTYQEISSATVDGSRPFVSLFFPLGGMLDQCYRDMGNKWQETSAVIDVFIQDKYFDSYSCTLEP